MGYHHMYVIILKRSLHGQHEGFIFQGPHVLLYLRTVVRENTFTSANFALLCDMGPLRWWLGFLAFFCMITTEVRKQSLRDFRTCSFSTGRRPGRQIPEGLFQGSGPGRLYVGSHTFSVATPAEPRGEFFLVKIFKIC